MFDDIDKYSDMNYKSRYYMHIIYRFYIYLCNCFTRNRISEVGNITDFIYNDLYKHGHHTKNYVLSAFKWLIP